MEGGLPFTNIWTILLLVVLKMLQNYALPFSELTVSVQLTSLTEEVVAEEGSMLETFFRSYSKQSGAKKTATVSKTTPSSSSTTDCDFLLNKSRTMHVSVPTKDLPSEVPSQHQQLLQVLQPCLHETVEYGIEFDSYQYIDGIKTVQQIRLKDRVQIWEDSLKPSELYLSTDSAIRKDNSQFANSNQKFTECEKAFSILEFKNFCINNHVDTGALTSLKLEVYSVLEKEITLYTVLGTKAYNKLINLHKKHYGTLQNETTPKKTKLKSHTKGGMERILTKPTCFSRDDKYKHEERLNHVYSSVFVLLFITILLHSDSSLIETFSLITLIQKNKQIFQFLYVTVPNQESKE
ncbi:Hypothetical predicted protein [Mytilus galloprovincialis]|uniref:Uncharacterized protein n=1 Tax=Mytilus galloprovincialis TaxID=29158 RepID=A0A8B6DF49_MYTGA|nr:Hypothetical predicted protein [Mytilus galloprovincialis]